MKRKYIVLFLIGLVLGSVLINTMTSVYYNKINVLQDHFINLISDVVINKFEMFKNGIVQYYKEFALILILNCFFFGKIYNGVYLFVKGLGVGIVLSSYVMKYGVKGMLVYILSIFPHYFLYVPAIILTICAGISMRNLIMDCIGKNSVYNIREIRGIDFFRIAKKVLIYFIVIMFFALVISFFEAYINVSIYMRLFV